MKSKRRKRRKLKPIFWRFILLVILTAFLFNAKIEYNGKDTASKAKNIWEKLLSAVTYVGKVKKAVM